ncbi:MAG: ribonuclease HIII [Bacillaceae bacterium]
MANIAIQVDNYTLNQMRTHYEKDLTTRTPKNAFFRVLGETCIITAYQTGRVTFLGNGATEEAAQWSQKEVVPTFKQETTSVKKDIAVSPPTPIIQEEKKTEKVEQQTEIIAPPIKEEVKTVEKPKTDVKEETITQPAIPTPAVETPVIETKEEILPTKKPIEKQADVNPYAPPHRVASLDLIGSYEVGSSDYFGPLCVVAVYVPRDKVSMLMKLGLMETKGMNDKQIVEIAKKVISAVEYVAVNISNEKYNEYLESGMSIGALKARLHNQAIRKVIEKIEGQPVDGILIDQFVEGNTYFQYLEQEKEVIKDNVYFKPKAETAHIATACASAIARYSYLRTLEKLTEIAGFKLPRGVNLQADKAAARLLKVYGLEALGSFVKLNFPNTQKARMMARR